MRSSAVVVVFVALASFGCAPNSANAPVDAGAARAGSAGQSGEPADTGSGVTASGASRGAQIPDGGVDYGPNVNAIAYGWSPALAYSGSRGESSDTAPSNDEILQDLHLLNGGWPLLRGYRVAEMVPVLEAIRANHQPLKVFLAAWLGKDSAANASEIEAAISVANDPRYSALILAVIAGNECQVSWSDHSVPATELVQHIRHLKASIRQPVTVADNWYWWAGQDASGANATAIATEVDFITSHFYPLMEEVINGSDTGVTIANAMAKTESEYEVVRKRYPAKYVAIGEAGWATSGVFFQTLNGEATEQNQRTYYRQLMAWAEARHVITFWFEAFDEKWKDPGEAGLEAHWGLFTRDRQPKAVLSP